MIALILVALSVGLSNLAAAIGVGAGGITAATRLRVLLVYGVFEAAMPVVGMALGASVAAGVGERARWLASGLLLAVGGYTVLEALRGGRDRAPGSEAGRGTSWLRLVISGMALSLDNVVAGFALGAYRVGLAAGALTFGTVSVLMSLAGLEFGARIGKRAGERGELIGGVVLIGVAVAIGMGALG